MGLTTTHGTKTVQDLVDLYSHDRLNLSPAFQRKSVWTVTDRRLLINSIFDNIPIPSIYLYRQVGRGGRPIYDVIDGKQRIESILAFMKLGPIYKRSDPLWIRRAFREDDDVEWWEWGELGNDEKHQFLTTQIPTIEVDGDLSEIIELFVRINATGKKLTQQEKRHAHYYTSPVLREAQKAADRLGPRLKSFGVLSAGQIQRMKHVELVTELMLSINAGMPLNKKKKIDEVIRGDGIQPAEIRQSVASLKSAIDVALVMLPDIRTTRFHQLADFYTLVLLLSRYHDEGLSITAHNSAKNRFAGELLRQFGASVDEVNERIRLGKGITAAQGPFYDYLMTVKEGTDSKPQRDSREKILRSVLAGVFDARDSSRTFTETQRRILWHSNSKKNCSVCGKKIKTWQELSIDHVQAYVKGGKTKLSNAAIAHRRCNSGKGAR